MVFLGDRNNLLKFGLCGIGLYFLMWSLLPEIFFVLIPLHFSLYCSLAIHFLESARFYFTSIRIYIVTYEEREKEYF